MEQVKDGMLGRNTRVTNAALTAQTYERPMPEATPRSERRRLPGLIVTFAAGAPQFAVRPLEEELVLGRDELVFGDAEDACMSRRHARVAFAGNRWVIEDLGSRNGTWVDGARVHGRVTLDKPRVLRLGGTILLLTANVGSFENSAVDLGANGFVVGPTLRRAWTEIAQVGRTSRTLHIFGETGAGKEGAARHFHDSSGRRSGPFFAVNCATIPPLLAERLLFGAKKGAFSGADANVGGYVQAANGGTLFLDEIGELDSGVQAKLLRVLQSGEVFQLGASSGIHVDVAICSATHRDLRAEVAAGRFRDDLYYRISRPMVELPALRDRPEDIAATVVQALRAVAPRLVADASLVEATLVRPWPGNVRELQMAIADAGRVALVGGMHDVTAEHLGVKPGRPLAETQESGRLTKDPPTRDMIEAAIRSTQGNVTKAARALRVHRTSLRRWIERFGIRPSDIVETNG